MYESLHCFRITAGTLHILKQSFFIDDVMVFTTFAFISGIVIHLSILCTYSKGLVVECILLSNIILTFIKYLLKALAIVLPSEVY